MLEANDNLMPVKSIFSIRPFHSRIFAPLPSLPGLKSLTNSEIKQDIKSVQQECFVRDSDDILSDDVLPSSFPVRPRKTSRFPRRFSHMVDDDHEHNEEYLGQIMEFFKSIEAANPEACQAEREREQLEIKYQAIKDAYLLRVTKFAELQKQYGNHYRALQGLAARNMQQYHLYNRRNAILCDILQCMRSRHSAIKALERDREVLAAASVTSPGTSSGGSSGKGSSKGKGRNSGSRGSPAVSVKEEHAEASAAGSKAAGTGTVGSTLLWPGEVQVSVLRVNIKARPSDANGGGGATEEVVLYKGQCVQTNMGMGCIAHIVPAQCKLVIKVGTFAVMYTNIKTYLAYIAKHRLEHSLSAPSDATAAPTESATAAGSMSDCIDAFSDSAMLHRWREMEKRIRLNDEYEHRINCAIGVSSLQKSSYPAAPTVAAAGAGATASSDAGSGSAGASGSSSGGYTPSSGAGPGSSTAATAVAAAAASAATNTRTQQQSSSTVYGLPKTVMAMFGKNSQVLQNFRQATAIARQQAADGALAASQTDSVGGLPAALLSQGVAVDDNDTEMETEASDNEDDEEEEEEETGESEEGTSVEGQEGARKKSADPGVAVAGAASGALSAKDDRLHQLEHGPHARGGPPHAQWLSSQHQRHNDLFEVTLPLIYAPVADIPAICDRMMLGGGNRAGPIVGGGGAVEPLRRSSAGSVGGEAAASAVNSNFDVRAFGPKTNSGIDINTDVNLLEGALNQLITQVKAVEDRQAALMNDVDALNSGTSEVMRNTLETRLSLLTGRGAKPSPIVRPVPRGGKFGSSKHGSNSQLSSLALISLQAANGGLSSHQPSSTDGNLSDSSVGSTAPSSSGNGGRGGSASLDFIAAAALSSLENPQDGNGSSNRGGGGIATAVHGSDSSLADSMNPSQGGGSTRGRGGKPPAAVSAKSSNGKDNGKDTGASNGRSQYNATRTSNITNITASNIVAATGRSCKRNAPDAPSASSSRGRERAGAGDDSDAGGNGEQTVAAAGGERKRSRRN